ncbi:MAG: hypothetical protein NT092_03195 [Bacteroidia bacterium]|nr:hypothetical protein [Bacteroidia bacterium]
MKRIIITNIIFVLLLFTFCSRDKTIKITFQDGDISKHAFAVSSINPDLPADWTDYEFMVLEFRASSPQRFEVGLRNPQGYLFKRIHPFEGALVRFVVPLDFYRAQPSRGNDMAATWNQPRKMGFINVEQGGFGPVGVIDSIMFRMITPLGNPTLEINSVTLSMTDPGDSLLSPGALVDQFGQWKSVEWEGKANSLEELQASWDIENKILTSGDFNYGKFGGYLNTQVKATGFFRVEQIDGRWWFVDPEGHLFLSTSSNGIGPGSTGTPSRGRDYIFDTLPPQQSTQGQNRFRNLNYLGWNLQRRYGDSWREKASEMTVRRMDAWGFTTGSQALQKPYITYFRASGGGAEIMGIPDVWSKEFADNVELRAKEQLIKQKDNPWIIGYFIGNEPPWPNRESLAVAAILEGPDTETRKTLMKFLEAGNNHDRKVEFCKITFQKYLDIVTSAIRKYDPNHLVLGIRFGGTPPDYIIEMAKIFDVYSLNTYAYKPNPDYLSKVYSLTGLPILIGEYHFGTPGRGMSSGLCQVKDQYNRGVAYRYYTENAFAHPAVIGAHWFQWSDEANTGRGDGENYNIGIIDVTDRPYRELTEAITQMHKILYKIHAGTTPPSDKLPEGTTKVDFKY